MKVICPVCSELVSVRKTDGLIRRHGYENGLLDETGCLGTGQKPNVDFGPAVALLRSKLPRESQTDFVLGFSAAIDVLESV